MAVLPNWMVGFGGSMVAGGPSSLFWGWIVVVTFVLGIAFSMAKVISTYPLAGGIYSWSFLLSNKKWGPFMAWISGYIYCIGLVTANMTLGWSSVDFIFGIANVLNVAEITSQGSYVGLYCGIFVLASFCNWFGMKFKPIQVTRYCASRAQANVLCTRRQVIQYYLILVFAQSAMTEQ